MLQQWWWAMLMLTSTGFDRIGGRGPRDMETSKIERRYASRIAGVSPTGLTRRAANWLLIAGSPLQTLFFS